MYEQIQHILPEDFDGVVRFTNWTKEDFTATWGKKNYTFPAEKTVPMVIMNATPLELLGIRKKFAKNLAEREFFKSEKYKELRSQEIDKNSRMPVLNSFKQALTYSLTELAPFIQKCLEPLPIDKASVSEASIEKVEDKLHKDEEGNLVTEPIDRKTSLRKKALEA